MNRYFRLAWIILASASLLGACKSAPKRVSMAKSQKKPPSEPRQSENQIGEDNDPPLIEGGVDPETPKTGEPGVVPSIEKSRKTLETIMLTASSKNDEACKAETLSSRASLRLLTKDEYQNSVVSILKVATDYRPSLPRETLIEGFRNNVDYGQVSDAHASAYLEAAINIGDEINPKIAALAGCSTLNEACAQKFIDNVGPKIWRRPLEAQEKEKLLVAYRTGASYSVRHGMTMLVSRFLASPHFLYRSEIGKEGKLDAYETASALSFFFWGTSPDDALIQQAASGKLLSEATLVAEAERLFADPRSRFATAEFARAWLDSQSVKGAIKDAAMFPNFTQDIKNAMADEAEDTFDFLMRQPNASFDTLFTNNFSVGDAKLAKYYGGTLGSSSTISFAGTNRKGVLGLGAVLALLATPKETHPIRRGTFVLNKIFCQHPDPTPTGLDVKVPEYSPTLSTRERFAKHTESTACASCHIAIDGIGLGMEDFDGAGIYRTTQSGKPIDSSGSVVDVDSKTSKFNGTGSLSEIIAKSKQARRCFAVEWYRLAHGHMERPADICAIRDIANSFESGKLSLGQLLIQIVTHPSFRNKGE